MVVKLLAAVGVALTLSGCVAYPAYYGPPSGGYYVAPSHGYYARPYYGPRGYWR